VHTVI